MRARADAVFGKQSVLVEPTRTHRWSEGDSNCRSLSRNESAFPAEREVPQRRKGLSRERRLSCGGTEGSNPLPSTGESANHRSLNIGRLSPHEAGRPHQFARRWSPTNGIHSVRAAL